MSAPLASPASAPPCARPPHSSAHVHLLVGPVGAGKTTFARALAREQRAVHLNLDSWMVTLFRADRPASGVIAWYAERVERCVAQIWQVAQDILSAATPVVLELGLIQRAERARFFERVDGSLHPLTIHALHAPRALRWARVEERNRTQSDSFSMVVPREIFELASDLWQPLSDEECAGRDVRFVSSDAP